MHSHRRSRLHSPRCSPRKGLLVNLRHAHQENQALNRRRDPVHNRPYNRPSNPQCSLRKYLPINLVHTRRSNQVLSHPGNLPINLPNSHQKFLLVSHPLGQLANRAIGLHASPRFSLRGRLQFNRQLNQQKSPRMCPAHSLVGDLVHSLLRCHRGSRLPSPQKFRQRSPHESRASNHQCSLLESHLTNLQ